MTSGARARQHTCRPSELEALIVGELPHVSVSTLVYKYVSPIGITHCPADEESCTQVWKYGAPGIFQDARQKIRVVREQPIISQRTPSQGKSSAKSRGSISDGIAVLSRCSVVNCSGAHAIEVAASPRQSIGRTELYRQLWFRL